MKFRRILSILCALSLTAGALCGCASETADATEAVAAEATSGDAQSGMQINSDATYVQVQSIDGTSVTAVVGTVGMGGMSQPQGDGQQEAPSGTPSADGGGQPSGESGSQPSDMPSGESGSQPSGGDNAQAGGPGGQGFTAGDETITFTIDDATVVTLADGTTGTIDDIAVDDILMLTLDDGNVALSVAIQQTFDAAAPASTDAVG